MPNKQLIYENPLASVADVQHFRLEGEANVSFPSGRLRLENAKDPDEGQKSNFVFWCPESFPADFVVEWKFWPIREPGLCILFFAGIGRDGEDLFESSLAKRTGEYDLYHHGDINAFHVSYFRRKWPEERSFHTCNLRKSYGFHLVAQGADPIPDTADAAGPYQLRLIKYRNQIQFEINDLLIFRWEDDGRTYGPLLGGGKIGFRQMAPLIAEYADLKVYALQEDNETEAMLRVKSYVDEHFAEHGISLTALSGMFGMNEKTLSRQFKTAFGQNFIDFVIGLRMNKARRLLAESDLPVVDIAEQAGYSSPISFRRTFKRLEGISPNDYRKWWKRQSAGKGQTIR